MQRMAMLEIPQDVLDSARLTLDELKIELALDLYMRGKLSIGKAREWAGLSLLQFRQAAAARRISPHLDSTTLQDDLETLRALGRL